MTPTLLGRWQIRLFLLSTVGLVISFLVGWIIGNLRLPLLALCFVLVVGCILDVLYQYIQSFRWDRDWPTIFQVGAGVLEGLLVWFLLAVVSRLMIPIPVFLSQYVSIWLVIFVLTQGPLRTLSPKWRYQGGEWLRSPTRRSQAVRSTSPFVPAQTQAPRPMRPSLPPNAASPIPPSPPPPTQQQY